MRRLTPETLRIPTQPMRLGEAVGQPVADAPMDNVVDAEEVFKRAFDEARDRGFDAGMQDAAREVDRRAEKIIQRLEHEHAEEVGRLREREAALRRLAEAIAEAADGFGREIEIVSVEAAYVALVRLLGDSVEKRELLQMHCRAVAREFGETSATLRVSEHDMAMLETTGLSLAVESDRRLGPGQCVIETSRGQFDCGLDVRLEAIRQAFLAGLRDHRNASP